MLQFEYFKVVTSWSPHSFLKQIIIILNGEHSPGGHMKQIVLVFKTLQSYLMFIILKVANLTSSSLFLLVIFVLGLVWLLIS